MSDQITRIVAANARALSGERVLTVDLGPGVRDLLEASPFTTDFFVARVLGIEAAAWLEPPADPFDVAVVSMPKERERLAMMLAMTLSTLADDGLVAVIGHNKAGIKGAERALADLVGSVRVVDARAHHRLLVARGTARPAALRDFRSESDQAGLRVVSYPGVFSHGTLDAGTRLLLEALPDVSGLGVLDVGCGDGVLSAWMASRGASVTATEVDAVAAVAARETLAANGLDGRIELADTLTDGPYDLIVSNPPFHRGIRTTTSVAERLIAEAPSHLGPGGELWIVVNRHLGHAARIGAAFGDVKVLAEDGRYQVIRARRGVRTQA